MKNKITDLRNHLFAQLERLNNEELTPEQLQAEIGRAQAISEIGKVIVDSAKTQVMAAKISGKRNMMPEISEDTADFIDTPVVPIQRPKAEYSNSGHQKSIEKYGGVSRFF